MCQHVLYPTIYLPCKSFLSVVTTIDIHFLKLSFSLARGVIEN